MLKKQLAESNKPELNLREQHLLKYSVLRPDMTLDEVKALFPEQFGNVKSIDEIQVKPGSFLDKVKKGEINIGWKDFSVWLIYQIWGNLKSQDDVIKLINYTNARLLTNKLKINFLPIKLAITLKNLEIEYAERRNDRILELNLNPEFVSSRSIRMRKLIKKLNADPEYVKERSERLKRLNKNPDFAKARDERILSVHKDSELTKKRILNLELAYSDPKLAKARQQRGGERFKKLHQSAGFTKERSDGLKKLHADPEFAEAHRGRLKKRWSDPKEKLKMLTTITLSPNKIETNFHEHFKDKIKFTGDRQFWIRFDVKYASGDKAGKFIHKNPDFKVHGQKKVIELYGDYWHQNDDPLELMINYRNAGYKCLIFWEYDIKNHMEEVIALTNLFINARTEEDWKLVEEKQFEFLGRAEAYLKSKKAKKEALRALAS